MSTNCFLWLESFIYNPMYCLITFCVIKSRFPSGHLTKYLGLSRNSFSIVLVTASSFFCSFDLLRTQECSIVFAFSSTWTIVYCCVFNGDSFIWIKGWILVVIVCWFCNKPILHPSLITGNKKKELSIDKRPLTTDFYWNGSIDLFDKLELKVDWIKSD